VRVENPFTGQDQVQTRRAGDGSWLPLSVSSRYSVIGTTAGKLGASCLPSASNGTQPTSPRPLPVALRSRPTTTESAPRSLQLSAESGMPRDKALDIADLRGRHLRDFRSVTAVISGLGFHLTLIRSAHVGGFVYLQSAKLHEARIAWTASIRLHTPRSTFRRSCRNSSSPDKPAAFNARCSRS
jgi:hypothetical protein